MKKKDKLAPETIEKLIAKRVGKIVGEVFGLVIGLGVLSLLLPRLPFVTAEYSSWLPIAVLAMVLSFIFNVVKHILFKPFTYVFEIFNLIPSIYSTYMLYRIYPLNFTSIGYTSLDKLFPSLLTLVVVVMLFAIVINLIKIILFPLEILTKLGVGKSKQE